MGTDNQIEMQVDSWSDGEYCKPVVVDFDVFKSRSGNFEFNSAAIYDKETGEELGVIVNRRFSGPGYEDLKISSEDAQKITDEIYEFIYANETSLDYECSEGTF